MTLMSFFLFVAGVPALRTKANALHATHMGEHQSCSQILHAFMHFGIV